MEPPTSTTKYFESIRHLPKDSEPRIAGEDFFGRSAGASEVAALGSPPEIFEPDEQGRLEAITAGVGVALRHCGGIGPALRKAWRVYSCEGWKGVQRRLISAGRSTGFARNDYAEWIRRYDTITPEKRAAMFAHINTFAHRPLISVLLPISSPNPKWLSHAIESVRRQIYPDWELCIVGNTPTQPKTEAILECYAKEDSRIKVVFSGQNGDGSNITNRALDLAQGEWTTILAEHDRLSEKALFWIAELVNRNPACQLIYSDEDRIDDAGKRFAPYFKCDWNVDLFYSHNIISHFGVFRTRLLNEIGGFNPDFEACRDFDLALRYIERLDQNQIFHIPHVLYHARANERESDAAEYEKSSASPLGERALNEHFQRQSIPASAAFIGHGYRVQYSLPNDPPLVSIIIPTRDRLHLLRKCVSSILAKTDYPNYEILIVDNGSESRATLRYLRKLESDPRIRILRDDQPFNFSALNNGAVKSARGELLTLLNNDVEVITADWLTEMVSHAARPGVGAVGARLLYPNGTLQHGGIILGIRGLVGHSHKHVRKNHRGYFCRASLTQAISAVTAACLVIRKEIYKNVGGLDELNLKVAYSDVDFCLRVREAGYRNIWTPFAELFHHESATRGYEDSPQKQARFAKEAAYLQKRWGTQLLSDPAYNQNLTLDFWDFSLAWPPRVHAIRNTTNNIVHPEPPTRTFFQPKITAPEITDAIYAGSDRSGGI